MAVAADVERRPLSTRWGWLHRAAVPLDGDPAAVARVVAGVALAVARAERVALPDVALLSAWGAPVPVAVPATVPADPWLVGESLEALLGTGERRRRGSHYTPRALAGAVAGLALEGVAIGPHLTVCDPAVGGGALLLAAVEALRAGGLAPAAAARQVGGVDVDPVAVAVAEAAVCLWAGGAARPDVEVADALARPTEAWGAPPGVVLGNPPFLGQLRTATARPPDRTGLRADLAALAGPYTDTAALLAALAVDLVAPGGRVALVLPRSFLAARDAGPARAATVADASLRHLWVPGARLFGAGVEVCVPVWQRHPRPGRRAMARNPVEPEVARSAGVPPRPAPPARPTRPLAAGGTWSALTAGLEGAAAVPSLDGLAAGGALGERCTATAGFRDQYYGLIPFVVDDPDDALDDATHAPLVTCGLIDPAASAWGKRPTRFAGRRWAAPRVDLAAVEAAGGALARWAAAKRVPKVLVAAQTRVVEAVADVGGTWLPSTPVATVVPEVGHHWRALAVLVSPVAAAWALHHHRGTALHGDSVRLSPAALRSLPTPAGLEAWDRAADAAEAASSAGDAAHRQVLLAEVASRMAEAYGLDPDPLLAWWASRLPGGAAQRRS